MKKIVTIITLLFIGVLASYSQSTPPVGIRGTYVDCAQDLIYQIHLGNLQPAIDFLDQIKQKNFDYIALFGLDHTSNTIDFPLGYLMGDSNFEIDISRFVTEAHIRGILVGVVISDKDFLRSTFTRPIDFHSLVLRSDCYPPEAQRVANPDEPVTPEAQYLSELVKVAIRTANYNSTEKYYGGYIDYVSVEFEYWTNAFYATPNCPYVTDGISSREYKAFTALKDLLSFIRNWVICSGRFATLRSEMELRLINFIPTTGVLNISDAQTQAIEIDNTDVDRILLVDYHRNQNALFGYNCDNLFWLGSPSSRPRTNILDLMSAEDGSYTKLVCQNYLPSSNPNWDNFLGNYLTSHTMADAESIWYNSLLTSNSTSCTNCSCSFSNGDNRIGGFMWFVSSIITDLAININRTSQSSHTYSNSNQFLYFDQSNSSLVIVDPENSTISVNVFNSLGQNVIKIDKVGSSVSSLNYLKSGIYFCKSINTSGQVNTFQFCIK